MLSISQTQSGFYCIEWSPTENGPKIIRCKYLKSNQKIYNEDTLENIINSFKPSLEVDSNSLSITLNNNNFLFSEIKTDKNISNKDFIKWYENDFLNKDFLKYHDIYYYPLFEKNNFLSVSISKKIKKNLKSISLNLGYNLVNFSIDIFSASNLIQKIYKVNDFLVWKIGKNNYHYLSYFKDNKICSFIKFKKSKNNLKELIKIGNDKNIINDFLFSVLIKNQNFEKIENVYVYQTNNSSRKINEICSKKSSNIDLINISNLFDSSINISLFETMKYVENGISFRGLDV